MTEIEVKQLLNRPRKIDEEKEKIRTQIEELYASLLPKAIRYDTDKVQSSPTDKQAEVVVRIRELENEEMLLDIKRDEALVEALNAIRKLSDRNEQNVLICFHINGYTEEDTADRVGYSVSHMWEIKKRAIRHLTEIL